MPQDFTICNIHNPLHKYALTYLKRSEKKVKFPWFNINRQATDKQGTYLQIQKKNAFGRCNVLCLHFQGSSIWDMNTTKNNNMNP